MKLSLKLPTYLNRLLLAHNYETEARFRDMGIDRDILFVTCDGLTGNQSLMTDMREILGLIQQHYEYPVDTEYTINFAPDGKYVIDLLQCRPLQLTADGDRVAFPEDIPSDRILLETKGVSMGFWQFRGKGKRLILLTPGRICTSSPELGVPSGFSDISEFSVIAEVSESSIGYIPELSYGSHIFQDLVESGILYTAVFEGKSTVVWNPRLLKGLPELTETLTNLPEDLKGIIGAFDASKAGMKLYYDMGEERLMILWNE